MTAGEFKYLCIGFGVAWVLCSLLWVVATTALVPGGPLK